MPDEQSEEWRSLTFSQRAGKAPLPEALQAEKLTKKFRNYIWRVIETGIRGYDTTYFFIRRCYYSYQFSILEKPHDAIPEATPEIVTKWLRNIIIEAESHKALTLVEYCLRIENIPEKFAAKIEEQFKHAPYYIDRSSKPVCIIPTTSEEMEESTKRALANINNSELTGAKSHFRDSSQELNNENYADSVRESIHAVASAARQIDPNAAKDLGPALDSLERSGIIKHRALKEAFKKLYGYASDEPGIRHPLGENESADVGFDEAVFM